MDALASIRETFFHECEDQLAELEAGLAKLEESGDDNETVNAVFRAVHSIKGGAGAFQLNALVRFAHVFETVLDCVRSRTIPVLPETLKTLFHAADALADLVSAARAGDDAESDRTQPIEVELQRIATTAAGDAETDAALDFEPVAFSLEPFEAEAASTPLHRFVLEFSPGSELYRKGNDAVRLLRELGRLGEVATLCELQAVPVLDELDPHGAYFRWRSEIKTQCDQAAIAEVFEFVEDDCELSITEFRDAPDHPACSVESDKVAERAPALEKPARQSDRSVAGAPKDSTTTTIRVDLERLDRLINQVGELVINQAVLSQRVEEAGFARSSGILTSLASLEQLTRDLQESVMATRAQPIKPLFQRMSRIVREIAEATGKSVRLRTEGEGTEIDRNVIERLADPLTHMIRNAIDHGLESSDERLAAGKPLQGEVRLSAVHRSGRIIIEVSDDGAGINRSRVKDIAIEKNLITAEAQLPDAEIDNLIFLPGFSTAATVSAVSGRGVGMDVVKRSIQSLAGRLSIASTPGAGSTFTMSLPLTLAVLDGMIVRVDEQVLVIPISVIAETMRPKRETIHRIGGDGFVLSYRGGFVPLIDAGAVLGFRQSFADPSYGVVLIVETEGAAPVALALDEIFDQRQVVIKSLEQNYRSVPGIAAATILGDGRVALILDVDSLASGARRLPGHVHNLATEALQQ